MQQHVANPVARQLLGAEFDAISSDGERVVALSIRRLETFDWIGITENFQTSVRMLAALLRSPEPATSIQLNRTYDKDGLGPYRELVAKTEPTPDETVLMRDVEFASIASYTDTHWSFSANVQWGDDRAANTR